jgi:hypothetical protein
LIKINNIKEDVNQQLKVKIVQTLAHRSVNLRLGKLDISISFQLQNIYINMKVFGLFPREFYQECASMYLQLPYHGELMNESKVFSINIIVIDGVKVNICLVSLENNLFVIILIC